jgi:thiamine biosynthesis lipoprotein
MQTFSFEAIGTHWKIDIYSTISSNAYEYLQGIIQTRIDAFEKAYSRFRADSYVNLTLTQLGEHTLPDDAEPLFSLYKKLYEITGGLFTPLIGQVLIDAGYDAEYSLVGTTTHTPPPLEDVLDYRYPQVVIKKQEIFDFGACGKGYLIDIISSLIREQGISSFCVDAGGDIRYESTQPLRVGLENPNDLTQAIGVATITSTSLCASAGSRRKWGTYHHIINPHTLTSPQQVIATWVLADATIIADALATCLFLVSPQKLNPHFTFEYLILFSDNSFEQSPSFPAELFLK